MGVTVRRTSGAARIAITGAASVRDVSEVYAALLSALADSRNVRLDLSGASSMDAAVAQLIVSARTSFESAGRTMELIDPQGLNARVFPGVCEEPRR